jgi:hypothetical protein
LGPRIGFDQTGSSPHRRLVPIADIRPPQPPRSNPEYRSDGRLNTARNSVTAVTFIVAVGFGSTQANAIAGINNTLRQNRPVLHPCMTGPPSTLRACLVMYAERGDTRNPITAATSSGSSIIPPSGARNGDPGAPRSAACRPASARLALKPAVLANSI